MTDSEKLALFDYIQDHEASDGVIARRLLWAKEAERELCLIRRALMAIQERSNMAKTFVFLHTCGFTLEDLEAIYQGCRLCTSDDGSILAAQWKAAKERITAAGMVGHSNAASICAATHPAATEYCDRARAALAKAKGE